MVSRIGRQRVTTAASPPTMIESFPSTARPTPPDTGASNRVRPRADNSVTSARVPTGDADVMSIRIAPGFPAAVSPATTPPSPISTFRTM